MLSMYFRDSIDINDIRLGVVQQRILADVEDVDLCIGRKILFLGNSPLNRGIFGRATICKVSDITVNDTDMELDGRKLFSILHSRDADITDNEFAEQCGFDGFMDMQENIIAKGVDIPFQGKVIYWDDFTKEAV